MMNRTQVLVAATLLLGTAVPSMAQGGSRNLGVPPGQRPPAGMCRIWIDGVPPGQQPAATDCRTAAARRPANSRIIYGSNATANRRVFSSNGDVLTQNNQRCIRRTDVNGRVQTVCRDSNDEARSVDRDHERDSDRNFDKSKGKDKHKHKGHGEHDRNH